MYPHTVDVYQTHIGSLCQMPFWPLALHTANISYTGSFAQSHVRSKLV